MHNNIIFKLKIKYLKNILPQTAYPFTLNSSFLTNMSQDNDTAKLIALVSVHGRYSDANILAILTMNNPRT